MDKNKDKGKSENTPSFNIRYELFDHLIYPLTIKLDENIIIAAFRKLHIMTSIDYKITLEDWIKISLQFMTGFTEKEAIIMFTTFRIFASDFEGSSNVNLTNTNNKYDVDVRYFGLFIALQLFIQKTKNSISMDTRDKVNWQNEKNTDYNSNNYSSNEKKIQLNSPMSSPRGKNSIRNSMNNMENSIILNFVKTNLKLFLKLISSDLHNVETTLKSTEFNTLKFMFKVYDKKNSNNANNNLSNYAHFFSNFSSTTKISVDVICDWLLNLINSNSNDYDDMIFLKGLSKCVTIKDSSFSGKHVKITNCDDSHIYINTNVISLKVSNCTNCTIFVAAASKVVSIDKCETCTICLATNLLRISNSIDTYIYSYLLQPPILYGDNRGLILGPSNVFYSDLQLHFKNAKLPINKSNFTHWTEPVIMNSQEEKSVFDVLNPKEFSRFICPFNNENSIFLAPKEYIDSIIEKESIMEKVKEIIKDANLFEEQEKALHVAIQGYFREWLVTSGNVKHIQELIKLMDFSGFQTHNTENN